MATDEESSCWFKSRSFSRMRDQDDRPRPVWRNRTAAQTRTLPSSEMYLGEEQTGFQVCGFDGMSQLWRPFLSDRYTFAMVKGLKPRRRLGEGIFKHRRPVALLPYVQPLRDT